MPVSVGFSLGIADHLPRRKGGRGNPYAANESPGNKLILQIIDRGISLPRAVFINACRIDVPIPPVNRVELPPPWRVIDRHC